MNEGEVSSQRVRVAVFLLVTAAVAVAFILVLGGARSLFARKVTLRTTFQNTGGLLVGSSVRLAGVDIGIVHSIHFDPDPKVRLVDVELKVRADDLQRIRKDSVAQVTSKGLLGDMIVDITVGDPEQPPMHDGDHIVSAEPAGLGTVVEGLGAAISKVDVLAGDVDLRVRELLTPQVAADLGRIAHSTAAVMEGVEHGRGLTHALIYEPALADDISGSVKSLRQSIVQVEGLLAEAKTGPGLLHGLLYDPKGGEAVGELQKTAASLEDIVATVQNGHGAIHSLIYEDETRNLVQDLSQAARIVRKLAEETEEGKGTIGGLLRDPTIYEDLTTVLGNLKRNDLLKALIRLTIVKDNLNATGRVGAPAPSPAAPASSPVAPASSPVAPASSPVAPAPPPEK
jgi:phospholipid/cholesterol/gamma-HCH transport system substrate-binding protein